MDSAWIGAERINTGGWQWVDKSPLTWTNWETESDKDQAAILSSQTGMRYEINYSQIISLKNSIDFI